MTPRLWMVAGANGSGKTTLVKKYNINNLIISNPDEIAKNLNFEDITKAHIAAGRIALKQRNDLINKRQSFIVETTLSGFGSFNLIKKAKAKGYKINLIYIGLKSSSMSIARVETRVVSGGHKVKQKDIIRRVSRSHKNLIKAIPVVDRVYIIDNTKQKPFLIAKIEQNCIKRYSAKIPIWAKNIYPKLEIDRGISL